MNFCWRWALAGTLAVVAAAHRAAAESWIWVSSSQDGQTAFLDTDSVREESDRVSAKVLTDVRGDPELMSYATSRVFDCKTWRSGIVSVTEYSGHAGGGRVTKSLQREQPAELQENRAGTVGREVAEAACAWARKSAKVEKCDVLLESDDRELRVLDAAPRRDSDGVVDAWVELHQYAEQGDPRGVLCRRAFYRVDCARGMVRTTGIALKYSDWLCTSQLKSSPRDPPGDWQRPVGWMRTLVDASCRLAVPLAPSGNPKH